ncbi:MAG: trp operon repressor [Treponema sp.]|jgi:TrpR family trp operon transcriptional repressor|nr:trp operon repressor [Treponema sp.]
MNKHINDNPVLLESYDELITLISNCSDKEFLKEFFGCLFTQGERTDIAERWQIVKELKAGTTQREIARKYNMSLCKITRGSKEIQKPDSAFVKMLDRL